MIINCNQCGVKIGEVDPLKSIGFQIQCLGGVYKIPILYGSSDPLYFCKGSCKDAYFSQHFTTEQRQDAKEFIDDIRKDIPKLAEDLANRLNEIQKKFKER